MKDDPNFEFVFFKLPSSVVFKYKIILKFEFAFSEILFTVGADGTVAYKRGEILHLTDSKFDWSSEAAKEYNGILSNYEIDRLLTDFPIIKSAIDDCKIDLWNESLPF